MSKLSSGLIPPLNGRARKPTGGCWIGWQNGGDNAKKWLRIDNIIKQRMIRRFQFSICILGLILMASCKTYLIPVESFKMQFAGLDSSKFKQLNVTGPIGESYNYLANPLKTIKCFDKKGNPYELINSPSIEIRFTYGERNKRTVFYFDRIYVNDSSVIGVQSRFISSIRKTIPLRSITKIEIQDGKKSFH